MRAVHILPTNLLGVVVDHGDWPVERISIGGGMGQLSIESDEDVNPSKNKLKTSQVETNDAELPQRRWWVGSVGHDDTLRMTDLEGFFRETEQAEKTGKGALAADVRDDDSDAEADENFGEDLREKSEATEPEPEPDSPEQGEGESDESDTPQPKKRKRKSGKDILNAVKKHKGKTSITVEPSFFDEL